MSFRDEFQMIDLLQDVKCVAVTRGVDAFALAVIKAERQVRKLFTFLVYQYPAFDRSHITPMREALAARDDIYFEGFIRGVDQISPIPVSQLVGADFASLSKAIKDATKIRHKIFHGQITNKQLSREELFSYVDQIRTWCERLAAKASTELGYDGFDRDSFRKAPHPGIDSRLRQPPLTTVEEYSILLAEVLSRFHKKQKTA